MRAKETAETDSPANFDSLEAFRKVLRELIGKGEAEPAIKSAILKQAVLKILIQKDGFEIPRRVFFIYFLRSKLLEFLFFRIFIFKVSGSRRLKESFAAAASRAA